MTLYLPTDEEAAEGIGAWDDTNTQPIVTHNELDGQALAAFELDRIARANEHYLSAQLAHSGSPYALLSGSVGNTKVPTACGNYCGPAPVVNRGAW